MAESGVRKIKWFWPWQDKEEEAWLRQMSQKGWHLSSIGLPCSYKFRSGGPRDYVYRLDYQTSPKKDKQGYQQLFRDAGWEYVGEMSSWQQYFRKEAKEGEAPEIFTDVESKVAMYRKVLNGFACLVVIEIAAFGHILWDDNPYSWWPIVRVVYVLVVVGLIYSIIRLTLRIRQLRRL